MTPLRLQRLEGRETPAGTVIATLSGGTWTIVGDGEANSIKINPDTTPGAFALNGTGTTVGGDTTPEGVKNIVLRMGGGDDVVVINDGGVVTPLAGSLTFKGGDGSNNLTVTDMTINGKLAVTNGDAADIAAGSFDHFTVITGTTVRGKTTVHNGDGNSFTLIQDVDGQFSSLDKGLTAKYGLGFDVTQIINMTIRDDLRVSTGAPLAGDALDASTLVVRTLGSTARCSIFGDVSYRVAGGPAVAILADARIRGDVSLAVGDGPATVSLDGVGQDEPVSITGDLSIVGAGTIAVNLGIADGGQSVGLAVAGNLTVTTGDAAADITAFKASVGGKTRITTGAAVDLIALDDSIFASLVVEIGGGNDRVDVEQRAGTTGQTLFFGKTRFDLGEGDDDFDAGRTPGEDQLLRVYAPTLILGGVGSDDFDYENVLDPLSFVQDDTFA